MLIAFAILTAFLAVWLIRDEIRDAGTLPPWVEHVGQDGEPMVFVLPPGVTHDDVYGMLAEIELLPVCPEAEPA